MTYPEAIRYLESFVNYEKIPSYPYKESLKLERVKDFLKIIGEPQKSLKCIHVAGSKGKGSTCAFLAYILREAGYKVGLYTSPHLSNFRERIRILNYQNTGSQSHKVTKSPNRRIKDFEGMISKKDLAGLVEALRGEIEEYNQRSKYGPLTFFEAVTILAFIYFKKNNVDIAVLETGLGGRLDATNIAKPLLSIITPISYEHTQKLGATLTEIAGEKCGIIKRNTVVISALQEEEPRKVIKNRCKKLNAELHEIRNGTEYRISLLGAHQLINAAVAVEAVKSLNIGAGIDCIKKGLENAVWPGRCEILSCSPYIVLDGAQNKASAKAIKKAIKENFHYKRLVLVLGISDDKDIKGICRELSRITDKVVLTKAKSVRAAPPDLLVRQFKNKESYITKNVKEARILAKSLAKKEDLILITGSLFVVGEFRDAEK